MTKVKVVVLLLILYVLLRAFVLEPNALVVKKYQVQCAELVGLRIVFLTDFHLKKRDYKRLNKIVKLTKSQQPDLVLIGGDYARDQDERKNMDVNLIASKLSLIEAPIYSVLGESDWWSDGKKTAAQLKANGIHVLENNAARLAIRRRYLDIIGLADLTTRQPNIDKAMTGTRKPRILITHNPDIYYDIMDEVTLILAGHTHGGQFVIPFTPPMFVPSKFGAEFASGVVSTNHNEMIISKGIGTTGFPVRFNCKPEIVLVEFVR